MITISKSTKITNDKHNDCLNTGIPVYFQLSFMEQKPGLSKRQIGKQLMLLNYDSGGNCSELPTQIGRELLI